VKNDGRMILTGTRRRFTLFAGCCLAMCLAGAAPLAVRAESDTLYAALVMATNEEKPAQPPPELREQAENLHAVFGYNQFRLLSQKHKKVPTGTEDWLVSSPKFFLRVDTKNPVPGGYALKLQLLQEKRVLAEADVKLRHDNPLFIRGPLVAEGQLIIVLMVL
jgi:hypothetical protein